MPYASAAPTFIWIPVCIAAIVFAIVCLVVWALIAALRRGFDALERGGSSIDFTSEELDAAERELVAEDALRLTGPHTA